MPVETLLRISDALRRFALKVGKFGSFFILPLVFFTMWDVVIRKLGGGQIWLIENLGCLCCVSRRQVTQECSRSFLGLVFSRKTLNHINGDLCETPLAIHLAQRVCERLSLR